MTKRTVLITGCSSGFGKLTAKTFQANGWNVIATMRSPEKDTELTALKNVTVERLDVTDKESIDDAISATLKQFGRIDALINNAGYGGHAMFEQFEYAQIIKMFETNVFGPMNLAAAVLPHMRRQRSGAIVNVTSMAGVIGLPFASTYSASKYAMEGWSEGLALEYAPFNVKVRTVQPGAFGTNFNAATDNNFAAGDTEIQERAQLMATHFVGLTQQMQEISGKVADPQDVAELIYSCATEDTPIHNPIGADAAMLMEMKASMPHQTFLGKMAEMLVPAV
ncbi:MAG: SDR family oxidoreductase [Candidatus Thiodiazotropha lotti]|nr:SDR family oxidoreductase [Candidatus Thiodiazotropha lotti]